MTGPDYQSLLVEDADGIRTITLNRPERRNAWGAVMQGELYDSLRRADGDDSVRVVILTGAGKYFTVGAEMDSDSIGADGTTEDEIDTREFLPRDVRKPVIAAINGDAVGAGTSFPLLCDMRIVAEEARMGFVFVRRGVLTEYGASWTAARLAGLTTAAELILTGRLFTGAEAVEMGLCNRCVPAERVLTEAREVATEMATKTAPLSVALAKRLLWDGLDRSFAEHLPVEGQMFGWLMRRPDAMEGIRSFLEKRDPQWEGTMADLDDFSD